RQGRTDREAEFRGCRGVEGRDRCGREGRRQGRASRGGRGRSKGRLISDKGGSSWIRPLSLDDICFPFVSRAIDTPPRDGESSRGIATSLDANGHCKRRSVSVCR